MPSYQTFDFPYHSVAHRYPAGDQTQFGKGYRHAAEPDLPVQRSFILTFPTLLYVKNPYTGAWLRRADTRVDPGEDAALTTLKKRSILCLDDFFAEHLVHKRFNYDHYLFGTLVCRFESPFELPKVQDSVRALSNNIPVDGFELRFVEHPE